jgi:uncharacterized protein
MFENRGRGIGQKGKDNGLLILLAMKERKVKIEVGYDLEGIVPDGYAGETNRVMTPQFAAGRFGAGLRIGVDRLAGHIAQGRGVSLGGAAGPGDESVPEVTQPVNDFARVIDPGDAQRMSAIVRALHDKTGDDAAVATVQTVAPFDSVDDYAARLFENHGRGIGDKGKGNGVLLLLAIKERRAKIEVGDDLDAAISNSVVAETSRLMTPQFSAGRYGAGLRVGLERLVGRIAQRRGVSIDGVAVPTGTSGGGGGSSSIPFSVIFLIFIAILVISRIGGGRGGRRFYGGGGWSGWSSGVGPFGGGWSSGGGGGFGGGFGGFGGGRSGGGGASGGW